jgi:6-phosphogluconolactonase
MAERALVLVGSYSSERDPGGIRLFEITDSKTTMRCAVLEDVEAGYLALSPDRRTVYAVDERKNDGRGPVGPAASIIALQANLENGTLGELNRQPASGPFPTFLSLNPEASKLVVASHGSFDHVERVVETDSGFRTEFVYDDSVVALYSLLKDGSLGGLLDLATLRGHGVDPCDSTQAGGHPQASAHAHGAQFDPTGRFVIVCDKGTDLIHVYRAEGGELLEVFTHRCPPGAGPRHPAFHPTLPLLVITNELASTVASFTFDALTGELAHLHTVDAVAPSMPITRTNELADIQFHPGGRFLCVNNRGQDTVVVFELDAETGQMAYTAHASLAHSEHPGLATRCFRFDPAGDRLFVADRPANLVRVFAFDPATGALSQTGDFSVPQPVFLLIAPIDRASA